MRLFHVSEESDISQFMPRVPKRNDLNKDIPLVWAISEMNLSHYLFPRECPRIIYRRNDLVKETNDLFSSNTIDKVIVIEKGWIHKIMNTTLYVYEFNENNFKLQDATAGYYTSEHTEYPIHKSVVKNALEELLKYNVEIRLVDQLQDMKENPKVRILDYSMIKMDNAKLVKK